MLLSVVIPTQNRSRYLSALLDSLFQQKAASITWEIIVVDNASTDDTFNITQEKAKSAPVPTRYVYEPKPGLHQGRHRGAHEANGDLIAFLDDDVILSPEWVSGVDLICVQKADAVVSRILPKWEEPPPVWLTELITDGRFSYLTLLDMGSETKQIDPLFVWGASFFIRRSLIFELGGFHPDGMPPGLLRYRGDGELGFFRTFKQQGYTAWYDARSIAYHRVSKERMTLNYLCQRAYNEGISHSYFLIRYADEIILSAKNEPRDMGFFLQRAREMSSADWLRSIRNRADGIRRRLFPTRQERIMNKLMRAHHAGWKYHQTEAQTDPELLAFVLKKNYLD